MAVVFFAITLLVENERIVPVAAKLGKIIRIPFLLSRKITSLAAKYWHSRYARGGSRYQRQPLQQPESAGLCIPHSAMLSRQRLDGLVEGARAMCADLLTIQSSGKPIRCVSCHGAVADVHAAHACRCVIRLEVESVSTRSRVYFDSKQTVVLLEV